MPSSRIRLFIAIILALTAISQANDFVWIEGENADTHNMRRHGWYDSVKKDNLSNNEWLSHFATGSPPVAQYDFTIAQAGSYYFWIRANSVAGPKLSYKLDTGPWTEVNSKTAVENINIASDGKPDMRFISWINAGRVNLAKGPHRIAFKFHSSNNNHGALDCFVFSAKPFMPRGALKPGQRTGKADPGYFAWEPEIDQFTSDALIDLSSLNEDVAGSQGHVKANANGFTLANGRPVKFWAANVGGLIHQLDHDSHIHLAKHLAKHGVNLVRIHGGIYSSSGPAVDMKKLDDLHHFVSALKNEGIYAKISFYFPAWFRLDPWHKEGNRWTFMLLFFDPDMQKIYFNWAKVLLTTQNPYTGLPLGKETAVAMLEVQNEDSHFFWTFDKKNAPPQRWETLKKLYGTWLHKKYGSLDKAISAWAAPRNPADNPDQGKIELLSAWNMTADGLKNAPANRKRVIDQVRFLTENMRGFYEKTISYFRTQCGYAGLTSCGNWRTADPATLGPLERYCYTAGDVIDHHGYFDYNHKGEAAGYSVRPDHTFTSQSALSLRQANPIPYVEIEGHPNIISEIGWPMPNMYRAEWPFLTAAYGSLNGLDAICHFSLGSADWDKAISKFPMSNPVVLGSFFAASLIYRNGYVAEGAAIVEENLNVDDLFALKGSGVFVRPALDQLRAEQIPSKQTGPIKQAIDPMSFYIGRVTRSFGDKSEDSMVADISKFIDHENKTITSTTGQLKLNYAAQVATINTPKAQGAAGMLNAKGAISLDNVDIKMTNDYGTVLVVALDDKPLDVSEKILIQCMTIDRLYAWQTSQPDGMAGTIRSVGSAPWGVEKIKASVTLRLKGQKPTKIIVCDENGYPKNEKTTISPTANSFKIKINETATYTVILR